MTLRGVVLAAFIAATGTGALAATGGPPISDVQTIALDVAHPGTIYAGVFSGPVPGGVYKSTDYGATWTLLNADSSFSVDVRAIVVDPVTPTNIYAGTTYTGVLKSTDGGVTWNGANSGLGSLPSVESLILDPANPSTLYTCVIGGIFKSTDGGASWTASNSGLSSTDVLGVTMQPGNSTVLYARVNGGGVYKSTNSGGSWSPANNGIASPYVYSLAIDPVNPATVYAGTYNSGMFKSIDGGATWTAINSGLTDLAMGNALALDPSNSNILYTASRGGVWKSIDGGANWTASDVGLEATTEFNNGAFNVLAVDPSHGGAVYLGGVLGGFYKSVDGAATWRAFDNGLSTSPMVLGLAVARANTANVYAGVLWGANSILGGIFESPNGAAGWNAVSFGLNQIQSLAIDASNPTNIYAGPNVGTVGFLSGGGVVKSVDGGVTWEAANTGLPTISGMANGSVTTTTAGVNALAIDASNPSTLYCAAGNTVFKTIDAGANWTPAGTGLPASDSAGALAVDPGNSNTIYAGTKAGALYKSVDGAGSWKALTTNLPNAAIAALAVSPASASTLYAGTNAGSIYVSSDSGATWTQASSGLPALGVLSMAVDPAVSTTLYAGTNGGGVFKSLDGGATWQATGDNTGNGAAPAATISKVSGDAQSAPSGQTLAIPLTVVVTNAAKVPVAGVTVNLSAGGGGSLTMTSVVTDSQGVAAASLTLGAVPGANTVTASAAGLGQVVFNATGNSATAVAISSVGNSASFTQAFAPGMLMSVFGTGLSSGAAQIVSTVPLPLVAASGTTVTINGMGAPLLYVSPTQINLQIPYELPPGNAVLTVKSGAQSASFSFTLGAAGPGIFVDYRNGNLLPNESVAAGSTIGFYVTGAGLVTPTEATGNAPSAGATPVPTLPVTVTIGGVTVTPVYIGIPSWSVGVLQINVTIPASLPAGVQAVVVSIGGVQSKTALLNVTP